MRFWNKPLSQYFVDILIVIAYWILVVTTDHILVSPDIPSSRLSSPSPLPELVTLVAIFSLYLIWDFIEVSINESPEFVDRMAYSRTVELREAAEARRQRASRPKEFRDENLREARLATAVTLVLLIAAWEIVSQCRPFCSTETATIDVALMGGLALYQTAQARVLRRS